MVNNAGGAFQAYGKEMSTAPPVFMPTSGFVYKPAQPQAMLANQVAVQPQMQ